MGPTACFGMGAGPGGLQAFCDHFRDTFNGWWDDRGQPTMDDETIALVVAGAAEAAGSEGHEDMLARRDAMITAIQQALRPYR
jgi:3-hydroxybutyryl-CoA dehydrogenase